MELRFLELLQKRFNFTANLVDGKNSWGLLTKDGKWSGTIGDVFNEKSTFGLCEVGLSLERMTVVTYSEHLFIDEKGFISKSPKMKSHGGNPLLTDRISTFVKMATIISAVIIVLLIPFTLKPLTFDLLQFNHHKYYLGVAAMKLFAIYVKQCECTTLKMYSFLFILILNFI